MRIPVLQHPFAAVLSAFVGLLSVPATAAFAPPAPPEMRSMLQQHGETQARAWLQGDAATLAEMLADDARLLTESQPTVVGRAAIAAYYRALFARFKVRAYTRSDVQTFDLGSRVGEVGLFVAEIAAKADGRVHRLRGKYLDLWERAGAGSLRLIVAASNGDAPFSDADALRFPDVPSVRTAFQPRVFPATGRQLEVTALGHLLGLAVIQHDAALWAQFYADEAVLLPNHSPRMVGRRAIDNYIAEHCRALPVFEHLDIRSDRIEEVDGFVYDFASHVACWRNGPSSGVGTGKNLRIWQRQPDDVLRMVLQIGSYD